MSSRASRGISIRESRSLSPPLTRIIHISSFATPSDYEVSIGVPKLPLVAVPRIEIGYYVSQNFRGEALASPLLTDPCRWQVS